MAEDHTTGDVRGEIAALALWAPLPPEDDDWWTEDAIDRFAAAINAVPTPISLAERTRLLPLLDYPQDDTIFGVLWGVLYLIETSPADGYECQLPDDDGTWWSRLRLRRENLKRR